MHVGAGKDDVQDLHRPHGTGTVAQADGDQRFGQALAEVLGDLAHHAEVDEGELPGRLAGGGVGDRRDEEVAGVGVEVDEGVLEDLLQVALDQHGGDLAAIDPRGGDGGVVGDLDGRDVLHGQHTTAGEFPHDARDLDARVGGEVLREPLGVGRLGEVLHLVQRGVGELLDEPRHVGPRRDGAIAGQPPTDPAQGGEVDLDHLLDVRPLDLDHDVAEPQFVRVRVAQPGPVRLPQGRGGERFLVEPGEVLRQGTPELGGGDGEQRVEFLGGHLVLEARQLVRDGPREHVQSGRQELAQLDHEPAEGDGQHAEACRGPLEALLARPLREPAEPQTGADHLPRDEAEDHPTEEEDDAPVAQA